MFMPTQMQQMQSPAAAMPYYPAQTDGGFDINSIMNLMMMMMVMVMMMKMMTGAMAQVE